MRKIKISREYEKITNEVMIGWICDECHAIAFLDRKAEYHLMDFHGFTYEQAILVMKWLRNLSFNNT